MSADVENQYEQLKRDEIGLLASDQLELGADYLEVFNFSDNGDIDRVFVDRVTELVDRGSISSKSRFFIRLAILQAFADMGPGPITKSRLQDYWKTVLPNKLRTKDQKDTYRNCGRMEFADIAAMAGLSRRANVRPHRNAPLRVSGLDAQGVPNSARKQPDDDRDELEKIARLERAASDLPTTIRRIVIDARADNGLFRELQITRRKACSVTGLKDVRILDACHIKPWSACEDSERLDVDNGLLLTPNLHRLFDTGLITFELDGRIRISRGLGNADRELVGIHEHMALQEPMNESMQDYMRYHNHKIFKED